VFFLDFFLYRTNQDLSNSRIRLRMKKEEIGEFQHAAVTWHWLAGPGNRGAVAAIFAEVSRTR
jgi:hypothetical protein